VQGISFGRNTRENLILIALKIYFNRRKGDWKMDKSNLIIDLENSLSAIGAPVNHPTNLGVTFAVLVMKGIITADEAMEIERYFKAKG
jgi:hypothetical protein